MDILSWLLWLWLLWLAVAVAGAVAPGFGWMAGWLAGWLAGYSVLGRRTRAPQVFFLCFGAVGFCSLWGLLGYFLSLDG
jgi:hypothetical protein